MQIKNVTKGYILKRTTVIVTKLKFEEKIAIGLPI